MQKQKSLITAFILDGNGSGKEVTWKEIEEWDPNQPGTLWLHLNYTAPRSRQWLNMKSGLDKVIIQAMTAEDTRPRCVFEKNGIMSLLRGVNLNPNEEPEDMVSVRIWIEKNRIISVRKRHIQSAKDIQEAIKQGRGPTSPAHFLAMLNDYLTNHIADVVDNTQDKTDLLENEVMSKESRLLRPRLADIRREALLIRRYLAPQREALYRLQMYKSPLIDEMSQLQIRESLDRIIRHTEDLDAIRDRASFIHEELTNRISEEVNERMYVLSMAAVIFLPLTFLTGLLGINVGGIPGSNNKWGFFIVCSILVGLGLITLWLFRRKKWM